MSTTQYRFDILGLRKMKYFSHKHKLHFFVTFEQDLASFILFDVELNVPSFRLHICKLSSVMLLYFSFQNEHIMISLS